MIAATVIAIWVFFGAGGGPFGELLEHAKDPIKSTITDKDRRKMALEELTSLNNAVEELNKGVSKDIKQFHKLVENYDSNWEQFDKMISASAEERQQELDTIWDRRSAMLKYIHADEWQAIVKGAQAKVKEKEKK